MSSEDTIIDMSVFETEKDDKEDLKWLYGVDTDDELEDALSCDDAE